MQEQSALLKAKDIEPPPQRSQASNAAELLFKQSYTDICIQIGTDREIDRWIDSYIDRWAVSCHVYFSDKLSICVLSQRASGSAVTV